MIKPGEYIQILDFCFNNSQEIFIYKTRQVKGDTLEMILRFDELRCLHSDYAKECEKWSIYAHQDLTKLNLYKQSIIDICNKFNINVSFTNYNSLEFRKGLHARYYYNKFEISDLFVFYIKRKRSYVSGL